VQQLGRTRGGSGRKIPRFDQGNPTPFERRLHRHTQARGPTPDNQKVEDGSLFKPCSARYFQNKPLNDQNLLIDLIRF
jgi:hypothetical protein